MTKPNHSYDVTIEAEERCGAWDCSTRWWVRAKRLSDGETTSHVFEWRWTARRFARSKRRIDRWFRYCEKQDRQDREKATPQQFTV